MTTAPPINGTSNRRVRSATPEGRRKLYVAARAELCRRRLSKFVETFWDTIIDEEPVWNWHIEFLCDELQEVAERAMRNEKKKYDLIVNVPPGTTKSTICSIMFPAWIWTRAAGSRMLCSSYSSPLSLDLSIRCRDVVLSSKYQESFPSVRLRGDRSTQQLYATTRHGLRFATSTGGSVTGYHGHFLIIDDPLDPSSAVSENGARRCNEWFDQTFSSRKVDKAVTPTILIMQRLGVNDLTAHLLDKGDQKKIKHLCLPCDSEWEIYPDDVKVEYEDNGGLLDPVRLDRSVLEEAKADLGPRLFAGQYGQSPRPHEGLMFDRSKFQVVDYYPAKTIARVRYWDKAGTKDGDGAQTAGVLMSIRRDGAVVVEDCIAKRWNFSDREKVIRNTAVADGVETKIYYEQEPGSGGKESAEATFKNLVGFYRQTDRPSGDKVTRAEPWSVEVNNENVYLLKGDWNLGFIGEHEDFPNGRLKDRVDASSGAYAKLAGLGGNRKRAGTW